MKGVAGIGVVPCDYWTWAYLLEVPESVVYIPKNQPKS